MRIAGRILIMPKGDWSGEKEYEMLDLVFHNGTSWLAKGNSKGVEPLAENDEYWQKVFDVDISLSSLVEQKINEYMENNP